MIQWFVLWRLYNLVEWAYQAARAHSILTTTLKDRLAGRVKHGKKPGPEPTLTPQEEEELVEFLKKCSKMKYGKTKNC